MKKTAIIVLLVVTLIALGCFGYFATRQKDKQPSTTLGSSGYGYNPNYADAIQHKKPDLCKKIAYALQSSPTDSIEKLSGQAAIKTCEQQANAGYFGCECDSEAILNAMRNRE